MEFNLFSQEIVDDPYPWYRELRGIGQPVKNDLFGFWMVGTHEHVTTVLRDPGRFSSEAMGNIGRVGEAFAKESMSAADPPEHHRLRNVVQRAFTPKAVNNLHAYTEMLSKELLADIEPGKPFDLLSTMADTLPLRVISRMMGVAGADEDAFRHSANALVVGNGILASPEQAEAAVDAGKALRKYFSELIPARRADPGDDLVSGLIKANENDTLGDNELLATCVFFLFAGMETTTNLITNAALALTEFPEQHARLIAEPSLMPSAIEELLRYCSPPQAVLRTATEDVEIAGQTISKSDNVIVLIGCADRDDEVFPRADQLILDRDPNPHVAFSFGPHYCLGASLARLQVRIALAHLLERAPGFRRANLAEQLAYRPGFFIRSVERLDLVY
ncbi:MAG TPA: cytochrome P450 [Mycobacterium sp.]|uniref:cytochrome P450 n=1 Tax=Mycobacterium sp. TaxID=1785 RepID=UPI002F404291